MSIRALDNQFNNKEEPKLLPSIPFTSYIVGAKKNGKTTLLINLLTNKNYLRNKFNEIYFISPTSKLDEKTQILKKDEVLIGNKKLIKRLEKEIVENDEIIDNELELYYNEIVDRPLYLEEKHYLEEIDIDFLQDLIDEQKNVIEMFGKEYCDNILLVLDDSIESKIIKDRRFKSFLFKSRHYKISIFFLSQSYFSLPKALRLNNSQLIIFENGNKKEINMIYNENNNGLDWNTWFSLYEEITSIPFNFMNINYDNTKKFRFINGLQEVINTMAHKEVQ